MSEWVLDEVKAILKEHLASCDVQYYLFGSWARGEQRGSSDIDIVINYEEELPRGLLADLREAFEQSTIPYRIDLVELPRTDLSFQEKVLQEAILWSD